MTTPCCDAAARLARLTIPRHEPNRPAHCDGCIRETVPDIRRGLCPGMPLDDERDAMTRYVEALVRALREARAACLLAHAVLDDRRACTCPENRPCKIATSLPQIDAALALWPKRAGREDSGE